MFRVILRMLALLPMLVRPVNPRDMEKMKDLVRAKFPNVRRLTTSELSQWLAEPIRAKAALLDVRSEKEFATSHLKGAIHTTRAQEVSRSIKKDLAVVVYCAVGYRAAEFAQKLENQGFANVYVLEGSIFQWANEGRELFRGSELVREVEATGKWAGLLKSLYRSK